MASPACISARTRFRNICWEVASIAKQQKELTVEKEHAISLETLKGLRADLRDLRDTQVYSKSHMRLRTWYIIEGTKLLLMSAGAILSLAQTIYQVVQDTSDKDDDCKPDITGIVLSAVLTGCLALIVFSQAGLDLREGIHKIKDEKKDREEKRFITTMDNLLQNIEWLLGEDKANSVNCHKYIASCYLYLKELPPGFVNEHEELQDLVTNLVTLLPEEDELKRTLTDLGSTIKDKDKDRDKSSQSAPPAMFLDISKVDRDSGLMHASTVFEIKPVPVDKTDLWVKMEGLLDLKVDTLNWNGVELLRPQQKDSHVIAAVHEDI